MIIKTMGLIIHGATPLASHGCWIGMVEGTLFSAPMMVKGEVDNESWAEVVDMDGNEDFLFYANRKLGTRITKDQLAIR